MTANGDDDLVALRLFSDFCGVSFWKWTRGAPQAGCHRNGGPPDAAVQDLLGQLDWNTRPSVVPAGNGRVLIVLPLPGDRESVAAGLLETSDLALAEKLANGAHLLVKQQLAYERQERELTACLEQLTFSMEEQAWLRSLSRQIEGASGRIELSEMVAEILPRLRKLIAAEAVGYVAADLATPVRTKLPVVWSGGPVPPDAACRRLIAAFGASARRRAVVAQDLDLPELLYPLRIRSLIVTAICQRHGIGGWLLAVNRSPDIVPISRDSDSGSRTSCDAEFGTVEAGLLEATAAILSSHFRNADALQHREEMIIRLMRTMSSAIDARDAYTRGHSQRVGRYAVAIGREMSLREQECQQLYLAGLLHDLGKIGVPDHVLLKPGRLTPQEFELIKMHPEIGYRILEPIGELAFALPGVLHHHERLDGKGYPHGLSGDEIPLMARILAAADAYDAMTSSRTYRTAMSDARAREILHEGAGSQWDSNVIAAFLSALAVASNGRDDAAGDEALTISPSIFDEDEPEDWQNHSMIVDLSLLESTEIMA